MPVIQITFNYDHLTNRTYESEVGTDFVKQRFKVRFFVPNPVIKGRDEDTADGLSANFNFLDFYTGVDNEQIELVFTRDAVDDVKYLGTIPDDSKDSVDDPNTDEFAELTEYIRSGIRNAKQSIKFYYDPHYNCYCKTRKVCGCGCDPLHDGW